MTTPDTASLLTTRIVIERRITARGDDEFLVEFTDGNGDDPNPFEVRVLLEMAKEAVLMGDCDCDCTEDDD